MVEFDIPQEDIAGVQIENFSVATNRKCRISQVYKIDGLWTSNSESFEREYFGVMLKTIMFFIDEKLIANESILRYLLQLRGKLSCLL